MNEDAIKFLSEIVKPWEVLNRELGRPFSMNPEINDYVNQANAIAVAIKHFPESTKGIKPEILVPESLDYTIISDLADSKKHGSLRKAERESKLSVSSLFERNKDAQVRFLRTKISILHNTHGKIDFMQCSMNSARFIMNKLGINTDWSPIVFNNTGDFSSEINVHASNEKQIVWTGMALEFVQINENGEYEPVDLNGSVLFTLTSDF